MTGGFQASDLFQHGVTGELGRLQALAEMHESTTRTLLASLVRPGWRCLDVGAGAGAVSQQLLTMVGSSGKVVATDVETTFLEPLAARGVEVVEHDIAAAPFASSEYDLVVSRFVIEWVKDREAALRHMLDAVRPGGLLVVETGDWDSRMAASHPPEFDAMIAAAAELFGPAGYEVDCGRRLPGRLESLGLRRVSGRTVSLLGRGGDTPFARWAAHSFERIVPTVVERGMLSKEAVDVVWNALADPSTRFWTAPAVAGWGWKGPD